MKSSLDQQLKKYSALSAGLITCTAVNATVQHSIDGYSSWTVPSHQFYSIDVNGDGADDFGFYTQGLVALGGNEQFNGELYGIGLNGSFVASGNRSTNFWPNSYFNYSAISSVGYMSQLNGGNTIDNTQSFQKDALILDSNGFFKSMSSPSFYTSSSYSPDVRLGNWTADNQTNYIGIQFDIAGNTHYGWIRVNIDNENHQWTIIDYAYEDVPNTPINAGATFFSPPGGSSLLATYSNSSLIASFQSSPQEQTIDEYRMFVVKEATTFGLAEAEANSNFISIAPDGSSTYAHYFDVTSPDSDGDIFTKSNKQAKFLDTDGQVISADQNYQVHILNMGATPYTYNNSLSTPSAVFTITGPEPVSVLENEKKFYTSFQNGQFNISIDNTLIGAQIEVFDILGKRHIIQKLKETRASFNINLPTGTYIIGIRKENYYSTKKFIVSK